MIRKFTNHGDALRFGSDFGKANNCTVWAKSVYFGTDESGHNKGSLTLIFGPSSAHMAGGQCCSCTVGGGWFFGHIGVMAESEEGRRLLALSEADPLPGKAEGNYGLAAAHTVGMTPDQLREVATEMTRTGNGVWHECNALYNRSNPDKPVPCPCGKCSPRKPVANRRSR